MAADLRVSGMSEVPPGSGRTVTVFAEKCISWIWGETDGIFEQRSRAVTSYLVLPQYGRTGTTWSINHICDQSRAN